MKCTCGAYKVYGAEPGSKLHSDWCDTKTNNHINNIVATNMQSLMAALMAGNYNAAPSTLSQGNGPPPPVPSISVTSTLSSMISGLTIPGSPRYLCIACTTGQPGVVMVKNSGGWFEVYCNSCASNSSRSVKSTELFHMPDYALLTQVFQDGSAVDTRNVMGRASCVDCRSNNKVTLATEFVYYQGNDIPASGRCLSHLAAINISGGWTTMTYTYGCPRDLKDSASYYFP